MIRAIILDDEQLSVDKLERLLTESGMVEVKEKFVEPTKIFEILKDNKVDAVFLDIKMPGIGGIELSDIQVQCLGRFSVLRGASEVKFRTEKAEELFAFLIDHRGSYVSRSKIIDCLWEEHKGDKALINFNTTLHYVKKALLQHGINIPIEYDRGSYRIGISGLSCDYYRFHGLASKLEHIDDMNISESEEAAGLYTGDYLSDREFPWAEQNRQMLKDQYISLLLGMAGHFKGICRYEKIIAWMKAGLIHEPLNREINYRLIESLLLTNDRISASRYYDIYRKGLRKKLGQEPDDDFKKLMP